MFLFFFYYFSFHTGKELENNYNLSEIIILLLTYILNFILVGASSAISLKEINEGFEIYNEYSKSNNEKKSSKVDKKYNKNGESDGIISESKKIGVVKDIMVSISFMVQSCLSLLLTILLNKMIIYILKDNINQKKFLYAIAGISIAWNIVSSFIFLIYSCPIKKIDKKNNDEENEKNDKYEQNYNLEELILLTHNQKNNNKQLIDKKTQTNGIEEKNIKKIKTCTFCGYLFFQKTTKDDKDICIFYKYSGKWLWIKTTFLRIINIIPVCLELYCQLHIVAFKPILSEKMLKDFSDWKSIGFIIYLIVFDMFGFIFSTIFSFYKLKKNFKKNNKIIPKSIIIIIPFISVCVFSLINFTISLIYYKIDKYKGVWDYLFIHILSCFKLIEFQLFSLFGIFNNEDFFNSSLLLVLERAIWNIIENILDSFEAKTKKLILIQIIFSSILGIPICLILAIAICSCLCIFKGRSEEENNQS